MYKIQDGDRITENRAKKWVQGCQFGGGSPNENNSNA